MDESNICVISLDALNLNFLQSRYQQNLKQPLSRAKNSNEFSTDFYYEFELQKVEQFDVNKEKSSNQELVYITCHICKIQVPQNFYHQHKYSFKHEINTKIANLAVQRLQKHLNCNYEIVNVPTNASTHFCPVCVTVMDSAEKKSHENSMGHKNSVIVQNFLNEFLNLYENAECQTDSSIMSNTLNTNGKNEMDVTVKKVVNISNIEDCSNENTIQTEYVNEDEETMAMKDYIILLKEKFKTEFIEFKVVNENGLVIKTVDGSLVRVNTDSFHSFKKIGPRTMQCAICQEVIATSKKHKHILTNKHMELLWSLPLENKDCMRHIDKTWNHCLLCNLGFENVYSHLLSAEHENNLTVCVLYESNNDKTNEEESTSSSVSGHNDINKSNETHLLHSEDLSMQDVNEYQKLSKDTEKSKSLSTVAVDNESYDLNQISTSQMNLVENVHNKQQFCTYCNDFFSKKGLKKHTDTPKHYMNTLSDFHYFMKVIDADDSENYLCRVCDEKVAKPIHEVKRHATLPKHLQNYNASLSRNKIKIFGRDLFFCCLCSVKILIKNEIFHINSKKHKRLIDLEAQNTSCAKSNATTSYLVDKNLKAPQLQLKTEIEKEVMKDTKNFFCDICNAFVPNTKHNIETHIKGGLHTKNMKKMFDKKVDVEEKGTVEGKINVDNVVNKNKVIDNSTKETNISTDKNLGNNYLNLQKTENAHVLKCLVCDVFITSNETNIGTHVNGLNHLNNYTIIMETNRLDIKDNDVYCNVCSVHISIGNEISHCKGKRHVSNLAATTLEEVVKDTKKFFCDICNVFVPNTKHNIETHIKGGLHTKNMKKMFDKKVDVEEKGTVEGKINVDNVVNKNKVIDNSTKETNISTDKKLGNNYYNLQKTENAHLLKCLVCDVFITSNETNIGTHVNGLNHLNNYTIIMETNRLDVKDNDVYCNVCSVHISIGNEISHCKGKRHVSNLAATTLS